jgi:hypothetical protein
MDHERKESIYRSGPYVIAAGDICDKTPVVGDDTAVDVIAARAAHPADSATATPSAEVECKTHAPAREGGAAYLAKSPSMTAVAGTAGHCIPRSFKPFEHVDPGIMMASEFLCAANGGRMAITFVDVLYAIEAPPGTLTLITPDNVSSIRKNAKVRGRLHEFRKSKTSQPGTIEYVDASGKMEFYYSNPRLQVLLHTQPSLPQCRRMRSADEAKNMLASMLHACASAEKILRSAAVKTKGAHRVSDIGSDAQRRLTDCCTVRFFSAAGEQRALKQLNAAKIQPPVMNPKRKDEYLNRLCTLSMYCDVVRQLRSYCDILAELIRLYPNDVPDCGWERYIPSGDDRDTLVQKAGVRADLYKIRRVIRFAHLVPDCILVRIIGGKHIAYPCDYVILAHAHKCWNIFAGCERFGSYQIDRLDDLVDAVIISGYRRGATARGSVSALFGPATPSRQKCDINAVANPVLAAAAAAAPSVVAPGGGCPSPPAVGNEESVSAASTPAGDTSVI